LGDAAPAILYAAPAPPRSNRPTVSCGDAHRIGLIRFKLGADQDGSGLVLADDRQQPGVHVLAKNTGTFLKLIDQAGREQLLKP
jgi:hypothetical protein